MSESEQTIRRYLLGELSESEQSALEEKYFTDPPAFDQVLRVESELVDSYVRGQLANDVRDRFEQSYMTHPARSDRVKFAAALASRLDQVEEHAIESEDSSWWSKILTALGGQKPTLRLSIALATLLVMFGGVWIFVETQRRQRALEQTAREEQQQRERQQSQQAADEAKRAAELAAQQATVGPSPQQIPQPTQNPTEGSLLRSVSLALTIGGVRGGPSNQVPRLVIPVGTIEARLLLNLKESNYPSYQASLQTITGVEVFSQKGVKPGKAKTGANFVFTVPAHKFADGDYVLTLRGVNPDGEVDDLTKSLFRVEKR